MKINYYSIVILLGLIMASSCKGPEGLPLPSEMPFQGTGAHIRIEQTNRQYVQGELIASNERGVYVLSRFANPEQIVEKELKFLLWHEVKAYTLHYAKGKNHNWRIPVYTLSTISHGFFLVFTLPINLIVTSIAAANATNEYALRKTELPHMELWRYARFPQGVPDGLALEDIR